MRDHRDNEMLKNLFILIGRLRSAKLTLYKIHFFGNKKGHKNILWKLVMCAALCISGVHEMQSNLLVISIEIVVIGG